jgi:hypothetical protein
MSCGCSLAISAAILQKKSAGDDPFCLLFPDYRQEELNMTHHWKSLLNRNLLVLAAFTAALAPQVLLAADQCPAQNATKHGTYVVFGTGTIVGVGPISAVGEITYDGLGNTHATYTASVNGTAYRGVTVTGTYTVNRDCTGSLAESDGSHYDFVAAPDGSKATWIQTDTGVVVSGTEARLKPTTTK